MQIQPSVVGSAVNWMYAPNELDKYSVADSNHKHSASDLDDNIEVTSAAD